MKILNNTDGQLQLSILASVMLPHQLNITYLTGHWSCLRSSWRILSWAIVFWNFFSFWVLGSTHWPEVATPAAASSWSPAPWTAASSLSHRARLLGPPVSPHAPSVPVGSPPGSPRGCVVPGNITINVHVNMCYNMRSFFSSKEKLDLPTTRA